MPSLSEWLIGAVQYWPALIEYKQWSPRAAGHDYATATSFSFPIEETLNAYWPQFSGILDNYWGRNFIHFHSDYFGVVVLILVGAAFGQYANKSFRQFWVVTGVVALLWAFGGYTPFFRLILAIVPGTIYFRAPSTIILRHRVRRVRAGGHRHGARARPTSEPQVCHWLGDRRTRLRRADVGRWIHARCRTR